MRATRFLVRRAVWVHCLLALALLSACAQLGVNTAAACCPADERARLERIIAEDLCLDRPPTVGWVNEAEREQSRRALQKILAIHPQEKPRFDATFDLEGTLKTPASEELPVVKYEPSRVSFTGRHGKSICGYVL